MLRMLRKGNALETYFKEVITGHRVEQNVPGYVWGWGGRVKLWKGLAGV